MCVYVCVDALVYECVVLNTASGYLLPASTHTALLSLKFFSLCFNGQRITDSEITDSEVTDSYSFNGQRIKTTRQVTR